MHWGRIWRSLQLAAITLHVVAGFVGLEGKALKPCHSFANSTERGNTSAHLRKPGNTSIRLVSPRVDRDDVTETYREYHFPYLHTFFLNLKNRKGRLQVVEFELHLA